MSVQVFSVVQVFYRENKRIILAAQKTRRLAERSRLQQGVRCGLYKLSPGDVGTGKAILYVCDDCSFRIYI